MKISPLAIPSNLRAVLQFYLWHSKGRKHVNYYLVIVSLNLAGAFSSHAQNFTLQSTPDIEAMTNAKTQWIDFNNDNLLDLFVTGTLGTGDSWAMIYYNNGDNTFNTYTLGNISNASVAFADYNKDGFIDIAMIGTKDNVPVFQLYKNNNGASFSTPAYTVTGLTNGSILWKDLNMDSQIDLLITGIDTNGVEHTLLYQFSDDNYELIAHNLPSVSNGALAVADFNNDGFNKLYISGLTSDGVPITRLYTVGKNFDFLIYADGLSGHAFNSISLTDYNEDGYIDILYSGLVEGTLTKESGILKNDGLNGFVSINNNLQNMSEASTDFADLNNDGMTDIILSGIDNGGIKHFKYYTNAMDYSFSEVAHTMPNIYNGDVTIGDYDNDGDLDIYQLGDSDITLQTNLYLSDQQTSIANTPPTAPANLMAKTTYDSVYLSWNPASDDLTNANSLTYNVYISKQTGGIDLLLSPMSDITSGFLRQPQNGNAGYKTNLALKSLPEGLYYWAVQSIDNGFAGSTFSEEGSFSICHPITIGNDTTICINNNFDLEIGTNTDIVNWYSKTNGLLLANNNMYSHLVTENDTIIAELTSSFGCTVYDTININVSLPHTFNLGQDTSICYGQEFNITLSDTFDSVNWYQPQKLLLADSYQFTRNIFTKDTIIAEVFNSLQCVSYDTIIVDALPLPAVNLGEDITICNKESVIVEVPDIWSAVNWSSLQKGVLAENTNQLLWNTLENDTLVVQIIDDFSCVNYDSLAVSVLPLPNFNIGYDTAVCFKENILLELPDIWDEINWLTTNSEVLAVGTNQYVHEVIKKDTIIAQVFDVNRCVNYDSIVVDVLTLPVFEIGNDTAVCYNQNILLKTGEGFEQVNWYSKESGMAIMENSWFLNYQVTKTDTLIAEVFNATGCVNYDTISVNMIPSPVYTLGEDLKICNTDSVSLTIGNEFERMNWFANGNLGLASNTSNYKFKLTDDITIWTEVSNAGGCVVYDTIYIEALALPEFDLGSDRSYCYGDSVNLLVENIGVAYNWFDKKDQMLNSSSNYTFFADSTHQLSLTIKDINQCVYEDSLRIVVNPLPKIEIIGSPEICESDSSNLVLKTNSIWDSIQWYTDGIENLLFANTTTHNIKLEETIEVSALLTDKNTCVQTDTFDVVVNKKPEAYAGLDTLLCYGESVRLGEKRADSNNLKIEWLPNLYLDNNQIDQPIATPTKSIRYNLKITNDAGCSTTDSVYIEVNPDIIIAAGTNKTICIGDSITIGGTPTASGSQFGYEYQWMPSTNIMGSTQANPVVYPSTKTTYTVLVISGQCNIQYDTIIVDVNPLPEIEIIETQSIGSNSSVQLYASGGTYYEWSPSELLDNATSQTPNVYPLKTTDFKVKVTDDNNCSQDGTVTVLVQNKLFIPKLFTPNADGSNEVFKLYGSGIKEVKLSVFNQNGKRVYYTDDIIEAMEVGWDGTHNGKQLSSGVYIWGLEGKFYNGEALAFDESNNGFIKLVR